MVKLYTDTLEGLPEGLAEHATETDDGKFVIDTANMGEFAIAPVAKLKSALSAERERAAKLERQLSRFKDLDPDAAREAMRKVEELGDDASIEQKASARFEELKKQLVEKHGREVERLSGTLKEMEALIQSEAVDSRIAAAIAAEKGDVDLLAPHARAAVRVKRDADGNYVRGPNGRLEVEVLGEDGKPLVDDKGDPLSLKAFVADHLKRRFPSGFEGSVPPGSGARQAGRNGAAPSPNPFKADSYNLTEAMRIARENPALAKQLAKDAGVPLEF